MEESRRVIGDRHISRKVKGNVLSSCVTSAYISGRQTMALTEKQQENQCPGLRKHPGKKIMGGKRVDRKRVDEVRGEIGEKESFNNKLVRSRLVWAGHVDRMGD